LRGVVPRGLVGGGQGLERVPPTVAVVVVVVAVAVIDETFRMVVVVVVVVKGKVMIRIPTRFQILGPGLTSKAMSNREHNLLLSRLLLPY